MYPIPALDEHDVTTTVINLGTETAELTAHLQYSHGEYALAPVEVPAGASVVFDFRQIARDGVPDLLGRTFEANDRPAFFYWSSRRGSHQLVARTLVQGDGRPDFYGFNCTTCCPEAPWGDIIPTSIAFNVGAAPSFQAVEYVSTCNGVTGPFAIFPASRTFSSPINWTGSQVSSVGYTNQSVSFTESVVRIGFDCLKRLGEIFGIGDVVVDECLDEHGPEDYDPRGSAGGCPAQSASCNECFGCCEQLQAVGDCRCDELPGQSGCTPTLLQEACRECKTTCLASHDIESCTLPLTCSP